MQTLEEKKMIATGNLFTEEVCFSLRESITKETQKSLAQYAQRFYVDQNRIVVPHQKNPFQITWDGEVIMNIKNSDALSDRMTFEMKKAYVNVPCSSDAVNLYGNMIIENISKKVAAAFIKTENDMIVNGADDGSMPSGLIRNKQAKTIQSQEIDDLLLQMFACEAEGISYRKSEYIWITTSAMLYKILLNAVMSEKITGFTNDYKLMGIPIKIIESINSEDIDIILVNLNVNYGLFLKDEGNIQMTQTNKTTYIELFFYKSMAGMSITSEGLVFGNLIEKLEEELKEQN